MRVLAFRRFVVCASEAVVDSHKSFLTVPAISTNIAKTKKKRKSEKNRKAVGSVRRDPESRLLPGAPLSCKLKSQEESAAKLSPIDLVDSDSPSG